MRLCVLTVIEVYGNDSGIQAVACGQNKSSVSKFLVEERGSAGVIYFFFCV
jgi:hypothetical protein